jgi:hypothetical protein
MEAWIALRPRAVAALLDKPAVAPSRFKNQIFHQLFPLVSSGHRCAPLRSDYTRNRIYVYFASMVASVLNFGNPR